MKLDPEVEKNIKKAEAAMDEIYHRSDMRLAELGMQLLDVEAKAARTGLAIDRAHVDLLRGNLRDHHPRVEEERIEDELSQLMNPDQS